jgi:hypothetical protein
MVGIKSGIPRRTKTFIFKCTREEHRHFLELSHAMGLSVSELCRWLLSREYENVIRNTIVQNLEVQNDRIVTNNCP